MKKSLLKNHGNKYKVIFTLFVVLIDFFVKNMYTFYVKQSSLNC